MLKLLGELVVGEAECCFDAAVPGAEFGEPVFVAGHPLHQERGCPRGPGLQPCPDDPQCQWQAVAEPGQFAHGLRLAVRALFSDQVPQQ